MPSIDRLPGSPKVPASPGELLTQMMLQYLSARNMMPAVVTEPLINSRGTFNPSVGPKGTLRLDPWRADDTTVTHELAHAVDAQIMKQYYEEELARSRANGFGKDTSLFQDAYDKLSQFSKMKDVPIRINKDWMGKEDPYRTSGVELVGHGVGNSAIPRSSEDAMWPAPNHIDASIATDFSILLDLAMRSIFPGKK